MGPIALGRDGATRNKGSEGTAPIVLASAATGIVDYIERLRGDVDRIFGHAGISPSMAGSPTLKLRLSAFCRLFEEAAELTGNDNFGLWFGNQFLPRDLGLWGYAAVSSPTLGSALENMVRLFAFHQASSMLRLVQDGGGLLRLEYQIQAPDILERRQDAELSLGMFLNVFRESCGQSWAPEEVHFEHPGPAETREHESAFGAPVYFSQPVNALFFRPEILARPMPARDPSLMAVMQTCLEQLSTLPTDQTSLVGQVRSIVRTKLPNGYPPLEKVSEDLRITPASLKRELSREGLVYKDLVEMTRCDLAMMYLRQRQLPFSEIAFLLGYSELSAFSRAVRRWTGESPRTVRARLYAG